MGFYSFKRILFPLIGDISVLYHKIVHVLFSCTLDCCVRRSSFVVCDFSNSVLCVDVVSYVYDEDEIKHPRIKTIDKIVKIDSTNSIFGTPCRFIYCLI